MQYIEYVQTDGACWFDTGLIPDDSTRFEIVEFTPLAKATNWQVYIGRSYTDMDPNTCMVFKANSNGNAYESKFGSYERVGSPSYSTGVTVNIKYAQSGLSVDNVFYSFSSGQGLQTADSHTIWIAAENNTNNWPTHRASNAKFGEIKFWTQEVLVADLVPAQSGSSIGFYDKVSNVFRPNLGTGTPIAGPVTSSIIVEPSIKVVGFSGETVSASVLTENYWVASIADGSWLTLDAESGTGNTVISISIDPNPDTSARTDTITFTDMNTTDEAVLTIKQKKYTDGQPMYIGDAEIAEFYLGADTITEMYLGTELVFSVSAGGGGDDTPDYCQSESPDYNEDACSCIQNGGEWIEDGENSYCDDGGGEGGCDSPECEECVQNGGEWIVPEIGDPYCQYAPDYCDSESEDYNEDACNCISAGGTWEDAGGGDWGCTCASDECNCVTGGGVWDDVNQECLY